MRDFDQILDECLERVALGETVAACLADFPAEAARLEPLLQVAAGLAAETAPTLSHAANRQAIARMLAAQKSQNVSNLTRDRYTGKSIQLSRRVRAWLKELSMSRKFSPLAYGFAAMLVLFGIVLFTTQRLPEAQPVATQTQIVPTELTDPTAVRPTATATRSLDEQLAIALGELPEPNRVEVDDSFVAGTRWNIYYYDDERVGLYLFDDVASAERFLAYFDVVYAWHKDRVLASYGGSNRELYDLLTLVLGENLTGTPPPAAMLTVEERLVIVQDSLPEPDRIERSESTAISQLAWNFYYGDEVVNISHFLQMAAAEGFLAVINAEYIWDAETIVALYSGDSREVFDMLTTAFGENSTASARPDAAPTSYYNDDFSFILRDELNLIEEPLVDGVLRVTLIEDEITLSVHPKPRFTPLLQWAIENLPPLASTTDAEHPHRGTVPDTAMHYTDESGTRGYLVENNEFVYHLSGHNVASERFEEVIGRLELRRAERIQREHYERNINGTLYRAVTTWPEALGEVNSADLFIKQNNQWQQPINDLPLADYSVLTPEKLLTDKLFLIQRTTGIGGSPLANTEYGNKLYALTLSTNELQTISDCGEGVLFCIGDYNAEFVARVHDRKTLQLYHHDGTLVREFLPPNEIAYLGGVTFAHSAGDLAFVTLDSIEQNVTTAATVYTWESPFNGAPQTLAPSENLTPRLTWEPTSICVQTYDGRSLGEQCFPIGSTALPDPTVGDGLLLRNFREGPDHVVQNGAMVEIDRLQFERWEQQPGTYPRSVVHDGKLYIVFAENDGEVTVIDEDENMTMLHTPERLEHDVYGVVGDWLIVASGAPGQIIGAVDGELEAIKLDGSESRIIDDNLIFHLPIFAPDNSYMIYNTPNGVMRWNADGSAVPLPIERMRGGAISGDGRYLALSVRDLAQGKSLLHLYTLPALDLILKQEFETQGDGLPSPIWHPDNQRVTPNGTGSTIIVGIDNSRIEIEKAYYPAFSPDGNWVALYRNVDDTPQTIFYDLRTDEIFVAPFVGLPAGWIR